MTREEQVAYCAGLFDGEGCILVRRFWDPLPKRNVRHSLHVQIKQVRPAPLQFVQSVFGGRLSFKKRTGKTARYAGEWVWEIDGANSTAVLTAMRPYLRLKGTEADVAIEFQSTKLQHGRGRSFKLGLMPDEVAVRDRLYSELRRLKQTHNDPAVQEEYAALPRTSLPVHA